MEEEVNLRDYINVILKRWWLVAVITLVATLLSGWSSLSKKDMYEAKATILIKDVANESKNQLASMLGFKSNTNAGFPNIITSRSVAEMVFDDLNLSKRIKNWDDPKAKKQSLIKSLMAMVDISGTELMEIKVKTEDAQLSADIANSLTTAGEQYWKTINYTEARKKREYIESQLPRVESDLRRAENAIKRFTLLSVDPNSMQGVELKRLQREYEIQNATYMMLRQEYESVKLDESKELAPFSLIDKAEAPVKPIKPKILLSFAIGLVFGGFSSVFLAFFFEYWEKTGKA